MLSATAPGSGAISAQYAPRCRAPRCDLMLSARLPRAANPRHPQTLTSSPRRFVTSSPKSAATPPRRSIPRRCSARTQATTRCCNCGSSTGSAPSIRNWTAHRSTNCCSRSETSTTWCSTSPSASPAPKCCSTGRASGLQTREAGAVLWDGCVARRKVPPPTATRDLSAIGMDAERVAVGQLVGKHVQRGLHRLAGQREAKPVEVDDLQPNAAAPSLRFGGYAAQDALQLDRAVGRIGLDAADEAAEQRDRVLNGLLDAVRRPGDRGVQRPDRAL